ncbi:MAG: sigma-70 family RNA polymerase sigma factor [Acidobacteria bacterium]|nr:sigma-70 family RNA polymerase sigma factor [Acidobacteriota bacterium]
MAEQTTENQNPGQTAFADRDELVERYRPYVYSIARQVLNTFPVKIDFEELAGYGMIGLLEAADRYDPRRKVSFVTFSYYRIKGAIFDGLRQMGILTRTPNSAWVRRESVLNDLVQTASDDEIENPAASVDDEIQTVEKFVDSLIPAYLLSLSEENAPDVADTRELPNVSVEFRETVRIVRDTVEELPEKEKEIIESLYFRQLSTTELAAKMGVNKSWVSRLHSKAVVRLRQRLAMKGVLANE